LSWLFENFHLEEIHFDYKPTDRNQPTQDFFANIVAAPLDGKTRVSRSVFFENCPPLLHQIKVHHAKALVNG
jgi:hypothetical protein